MRYLILVLMLLAGCSGPPQAFDEQNPEETADDMSKYPRIQPAPHGVPQVAAVTPRTGGWSGDNQLGYELPFAPDANNRQTVLKLDEWGPPEIWTVSLGIRYKGLTSDTQTFDVAAQINFGAGGATQVVEMDWLNGARIALPMNAVNVVAKYDIKPGFTPPADLYLSVMLSRGTYAGQVAQRSFWFDIEPGPSRTTPIKIPNFAKRVRLMTQNGAFPATTILRLMGNASLTGDIASVTFANYSTLAAYSAGVPIPRFAKYFCVENTDPGAGDVPAWVIFELE